MVQLMVVVMKRETQATLDEELDDSMNVYKAAFGMAHHRFQSVSPMQIHEAKASLVYHW